VQLFAISYRNLFRVQSGVGSQKRRAGSSSSIQRALGDQLQHFAGETIFSIKLDSSLTKNGHGRLTGLLSGDSASRTLCLRDVANEDSSTAWIGNHETPLLGESPGEREPRSQESQEWLA